MISVCVVMCECVPPLALPVALQAEIHQEDAQALQSRLSPPAAPDMSFSVSQQCTHLL